MSFVAVTVEFERANAYQAPFCISPVYVFGITMLTHALGLEMPNNRATRVGIVHHQFEYRAERLGYNKYQFHQYQASSFIDVDDHGKGMKNLKGYKSAAKHVPLSDQPVAEADGEITLVFEMENPPKARKLKRTLLTKRIAGGRIVNVSEPVTADRLSGNKENPGVMQKIKGGFWIKDASNEFLGGSQDVVSDFFDSINPPWTGSSAENSEESETRKRWLVPASLGYAALSDFSDQRTGIRSASPDHTSEPTRHAFVEPLIGICEFSGTKQVQASDSVLWTMEYLEPDIVRVTSQPEHQ